MEHLKRLAKDAIENKETQLREHKSSLRIISFRIDKHRILVDKIGMGRWKVKGMEQDRLRALASHDIRILEQYKKECLSNIAKLEQQRTKQKR